MKKEKSLYSPIPPVLLMFLMGVIVFLIFFGCIGMNLLGNLNRDIENEENSCNQILLVLPSDDPTPIISLVDTLLRQEYLGFEHVINRKIDFSYRNTEFVEYKNQLSELNIIFEENNFTWEGKQEEHQKFYLLKRNISFFISEYKDMLKR